MRLSYIRNFVILNGIVVIDINKKYFVCEVSMRTFFVLIEFFKMITSMLLAAVIVGVGAIIMACLMYISMLGEVYYEYKTKISRYKNEH